MVARGKYGAVTGPAESVENLGKALRWTADSYTSLAGYCGDGGIGE